MSLFIELPLRIPTSSRLNTINFLELVDIVYESVIQGHKPLSVGEKYEACVPSVFSIASVIIMSIQFESFELLCTHPNKSILAVQMVQQDCYKPVVRTVILNYQFLTDCQIALGP